ncbi:MAG: hypothetical protein NTZ26_08280 [Candidatus Aminicenantes bacterium]|nr:hypothetical protein [Candidatus Aminicenantes bacterium]
MKKSTLIGVLSVLALALLGPSVSGHAAAQAGKLGGVFNFVEDSDGGKPEAGAIVTLTFADGNVVFSSLRPGGVQADKGTYVIQGNRITLRFDKMPFGCQDKIYIFDGESLSLPMKILTAGDGYSIWKKTGETGTSGGQGQGGTKGRDGRDTGKMTGATKPIESFTELEGDWEGKGAGAEVRFRREARLGGGKFNVMTLTTKHIVEFFFHVYPDQHLEGEGVILFNLEPDLSGVDALAGAVKGLLGMMPYMSPPAPEKKGDWGKAAGSVSDKMASGTLSAGGVTSPSYSYKMREAPQKRHFKIQGKAYRSETGVYKIHLEALGDYFRAADLTNADNRLWVDYEVNLKREESSFPTWSPFLKGADGDGLIRASAGGAVYIADSEFSGNRRNGVKPWEEYTFTWSARKAGGQ